VDEDGSLQDVTSSDVNAYLQQITGQDVTAKDFRTWAGTVLACLELRAADTFENITQGKRNVRAAIGNVAARLGNTPTICRKCYVHPDVLTSYLDRTLMSEMDRELGRELAGLQAEEAAVMRFLQRGRESKNGTTRAKAGSSHSLNVAASADK
jgi:DNA topoisomerase-1